MGRGVVDQVVPLTVQWGDRLLQVSSTSSSSFAPTVHFLTAKDQHQAGSKDLTGWQALMAAVPTSSNTLESHGSAWNTI